jgi:methionine synthase II (cobalamin-independent)
VTSASGIGSWPGTDVAEALRIQRELLGDHDEQADGVRGIPSLPELPGRGPGGDIVGRSAGLLVDLAVDLQPAGWRFVDRPGKDAARTAAYWGEDLDEVAAAFDGYAGPFKVALAGPLTLAADIWLHRGERALVDVGACRDISESLAEGLRTLVVRLTRLVPGADLIVQLDEPSLNAVLGGGLPTASGFGRLRALDVQDALPMLQTVLAAAGEHRTMVHCCAAYPPLPLLRRSGTGGLSVDTTVLTPRGWEGLAVAVEDGVVLAAGCVPTAPDATVGPVALADRIATAWARVGMPPAHLDELVVTPTCGLAGLSPSAAVTRQRACLQVAAELVTRSRT